MERTGIDALAVNIGQVHLHGRGQVRLDLARLAALRAAVPVPLVLHGATSVRRADLAEAAASGHPQDQRRQRHQTGLLRGAAPGRHRRGRAYNPYDVIGSGFDVDVLTAGRVAMQAVVEEMMRLFGSAGKA